MKSAALELGKHGITVNALIPGLIDTPLTRHKERYEQVLQEAGKPTGSPVMEEEARKTMGKSPLGVPWIEPEAVAPVVVLLASRGAYGVGCHLTMLQAGTAPQHRIIGVVLESWWLMAQLELSRAVCRHVSPYQEPRGRPLMAEELANNMWLSCGLAFVGGYADAASFILAKTCTGHVTGNFVLTAISIAGRDWPTCFRRLLAIALFLTGILLSVTLERLVAKQPTWSFLPAVMGLEIVLIALAYYALDFASGRRARTLCRLHGSCTGPAKWGSASSQRDQRPHDVCYGDAHQFAYRRSQKIHFSRRRQSQNPIQQSACSAGFGWPLYWGPHWGPRWCFILKSAESSGPH